MNWTTFINEWGLLLMIITTGFAIASYRRYKAIKQEKKIKGLKQIEHLDGALTHTELKKKDSAEPMVPKPPVTQSRNNEETYDSFVGMFDDVEKDSKKHLSEDALKNFQDIFSIVEKSSEKFDTDMEEKFKALQAELEGVHKRRKQIKDLGFNLSKYYEKYDEREKLLRGIMKGLENVLKIAKKKTEEEKKGGQNDTSIGSKVPV